MTKTQNLFYSCVDSRIQDQGSMYARFHLGTFFRGQALTFANALRRTLLSEIPGVVITDVAIEGASHEFASLSGVEESVFDILLNLKNLVFSTTIQNVTELENFQATGYLKRKGPASLTAADFQFPTTVNCINPNTPIATLTTGAQLSLSLDLRFVNPQHAGKNKKMQSAQSNSSKLCLDTIPMPVQKVNYVIKSLNAAQGSEYIVLEVWTDGSLTPQASVQFALKNLTQLFFQFAERSKQKSSINPEFRTE